MRVLMLHNYYQQPGGEDECFAAEASLLEAHGHEVDRVVLHNDGIPELGMVRVAAKTIWNQAMYRDLRRRIRDRRPHIVHAHNLFPLISPAAYHAAAAEGVPVVQTIHNFRLLCVNAQFFRDGRPCEDCLGRAVPWPGVRHRCYRGSTGLSAGVAAMLALHRAMGTWRDRVDVIIALTGFVQRKLVEGGIPAAQITVKPNFLGEDPGAGNGTRDGEVLFVGRLSPEKGLATLLDAWALLSGPRRLKVVGDGPFGAEVAARAARDPRIELLGRRAAPEVLRLMQGAAAVAVPSKWYENCPRVIIEALAVGTPILASRLGALSELVEDGRTGRLFTPGDPDDLARCLREMLQDDAAYAAMRARARCEFLARYTAAANYEALMRIYERATRPAVLDS